MKNPVTQAATGKAPHILVDADACPVKEEIYKVAFRYGTPVELVANSWLRIPRHALITMSVVSDGFDAADDFIAEKAGACTIVITADILLAERCLKAGSLVLGPTGRAFTMDSIGAAIATRAIMNDLRGAGDQGEGLGRGGGPPPFAKSDRSRFLSALDEALVQLRNQAS